MPADIVNLNKFRKAKARDEKDKRASENRAKFGQSKAERVAADDERTRRDKLLDEAQRDTKAREPDSDDPDGGLDPGTVS